MEHADVLRFVGVTGLPGSGKGVFIDELRAQLEKKGVGTRYYSLSDELRLEARRRGLAVERRVLRDIANELRFKHGSGILSQMVADKIRSDCRAVPAGTESVVIIDAIRNPEEVLLLRRELGAVFALVGVEAPLEVLVERISSRARFDEPEEYVRQREAARKMILGESGQDEPAHGHAIARCVAMADWRVDNSGSFDELAAQTTRFVQKMIPITTRH